MQITVKGFESCIKSTLGQQRRVTITDQSGILTECNWNGRAVLKFTVARIPHMPITVGRGRSNDGKLYTIISAWGAWLPAEMGSGDKRAQLRIQFWDYNPAELFCWMIYPTRSQRRCTSSIFRIEESGRRQLRKIIDIAEEE